MALAKDNIPAGEAFSGWLPTKWLQRVAGLFSRNFCPSSIAGKVLRESQPDLIAALFDFRSKVESSQSGLEQSHCLNEISLKPQLSHLKWKR